MPSGEQLSCGQSASTDIRHVKHHGISSLPDEMLFKILRDVPQYPSDLVLVAKLPFVCKKWREVLYLQGGHHHISFASRCWYLKAHPQGVWGLTSMRKHMQGGLCRRFI